MAQATNIEWADKVWNVVRGCTRVSPGCGLTDVGGCYAERMAIRQSGPGGAYEGLVKSTPHGPRWTGEIHTVPELLDHPLHWKKPARIFVNSMSDLFHEDVPRSFLLNVFSVMEMANWHTYQILTKRPERMAKEVTAHAEWMDYAAGPGTFLRRFSHVWFGVSVESPDYLWRLDELVKIPAAVRFVSIEPMLAAVDISPWLPCWHCRDFGIVGSCVQDMHECGACKGESTEKADHRLSWVIVGGESGPGARPCDLEWIQRIVDQCQAAEIAAFVKQLGASPYYITEFDAYCKFPIRDRKGGDMSEFPDGMKVREFPT